MITVIDTETTGFNPIEDRVVELALVSLTDTGEITLAWSTLINPGRDIPPTARAIHHISDEDVANAPPLTAAMMLASLMHGLKNVTTAAHHAEFDEAFLGLPIQICTRRCAGHVWPDAPAFTNQVLRYWLPGLDLEIAASALAYSKCRAASLISPPHRALPDAWVTAHILRRLLAEHTVSELVALTKAPLIHKTIHFGMHKGTPWPEVPKDYLQWLLKQPELDPDVRFTAEVHSRVKRAPRLIVDNTYL